MSELTPPIPLAALSLQNAEAAQWNKNLLREFQAELERNPKADLLSMFPELYRHEHRNSQYLQLSHAGKINLRTLHDLRETLRDDPEINMLSVFPKNYNRKMTMATGQKVLPSTGIDIPEQGPEFRTRLDNAESAKIVFPLSSTVIALITKYSKGSPNDPKNALATSLKQLLLDSPKLWESPARGMVVQCSENIVAKVVIGNGDSTEYTSLRFLAERAPDIPVPRAHGMVALGPFSVIFMSYVPGMTLAQAWSALSQTEKSSIQQQLEDIFSRLRSLQPDNQNIGGVHGEGAKESRINEIALFKDIRTPQQFSDLQFSARHHGSNAYVDFLRSFLQNEDPSMLRSVFTHGDLRTANIMVKQDPHVDRHTITGIIDWEDSGFYPAYYEATALTRTLSPIDEDDWYFYLPRSISPSEFPMRWLVDRLWGIHLRTT
jgi:aminoglycoside phosphotransferase